MMTIREATEDDPLDSFALWSEENDGDTIEVAEVDGRIVGFIQRDGAYIRFVESIQKGVGRLLVAHVQAEHEWVQACNVGPECAGFWQRIGFERAEPTGARPGEYHYEWYREEV